MAYQPVLRLDELPPGSRRLVDVDGHEIGLFHLSDAIVAVRNRCPHAGAPLCVGTVTGTTVAESPSEIDWIRDGEILRCPWHRWEFDLRTGETLTQPRLQARTYPARVRDGLVEIDLSRANGGGHD